MPPRADRNRMGALFRSNSELFVHTGTPTNYYDAFIAPKRDYRQTVTSGYTQADIRVSAALNVRVGVRWERTQNAVTEWDPRFRDEVTAAGYPVNATGLATTFAGLRYQYQSLPRVTRRAEYDNFFPSISGKYYLLRDLELQAGYSKAIGRPPIDNLAGLWSIVEDANGVTQRIDAPNPALLPENIKKYDARLAYYFGARGSRSPGQISLGVSQFDIANLRETFDYTATIPFARPATATAAVATGIWNFPTSKRWASCRRSFAARVLTSPTRARMRAPAATVSRRTVCPPVSAMPTVDLTARSAWCGRMSGRTETTVATGPSRPNSICRPRGNSPTATRSTCRPATLPISR
jgi:hypothetical protein